MFRPNNNLIPSQFNDFFAMHNQFHSYNTRNADNYIIPKIDSEIVRNSITYNGPIIWNSLSPDITNCKSLNSFKRKYKSKLISEYN